MSVQEGRRAVIQRQELPDRLRGLLARTPRLRWISFLCVLAILSGMAIWSRIGPFLLTAERVEAEVSTAIEENRLYEAELLLEHADEYRLLRSERFAELRSELAGKQAVFFRVSRFVKGFVVGNGPSGEEIAGAVAGDLWIWGDVRDLGIQGWHMARGEEVDKLISVCSAVGILATADPQVDFVVSVFKRGARIMSRELAVSLTRVLELAAREKNLARLADLARALSATSRELAAMPLILKCARTTDELIVLAGALAIQGRAAARELIVFGPLGVRLAKCTYKQSWPAFWEASATLLAWFGSMSVTALLGVVPMLAGFLTLVLFGGIWLLGQAVPPHLYVLPASALRYLVRCVRGVTESAGWPNRRRETA